MTPLVDTEGLHRTYRTKQGDAGLPPIDLVVEGGECVAVTGPSGCGKSTLLNVLGLIDRPTGGRYSLAGEPTARWRGRSLARARATRIGFVFQAYHLLGSLTSTENVELGLALAGWPRKERRARALASLEQVDMAHRAESPAAELSGGEQQRVAVARATAHDPLLVLADEPTGNLDEANEALVLDALRSCVSTSRCVVVVTHSRSVARWADREVRLGAGEHSRRAPHRRPEALAGPSARGISWWDTPR